MNVLKFKELPLNRLTALWNEAFSDYIVPIRLTDTGLKHRLESLNLSTEDSLVATIAGEPAGIMLVGQEEFKGEKVAWIGGMGVRPTFRRQGLAEKLLLAGIENLKAKDCQELLLEVIVGNDRAENLYRQLGFKELNRVSVAHGPLPHTVSLELTLEASEVSHEHLALEPTLTTWQNRLGRQGCLQNIYQGTDFLGYVFYDLNEQSTGEQVLLLKQFVLENVTPAIITTVLAKLGQLHQTTNAQYSNLNISSPVTDQLLELGFTEQLQQIQMSYSL